VQDGVQEGAHEPEERAARHCGLDEEHVGVCDMAQNPAHRRAVVRGSIHTEPGSTALAEECAVRCLSRLSSLVVVVCGSGNMALKLFAWCSANAPPNVGLPVRKYQYRGRTASSHREAKFGFREAAGLGEGKARNGIFWQLNALHLGLSLCTSRISSRRRRQKP
jgi:hypothetical protein